MSKRKNMPQKQSEKLFSRTADGAHSKNYRPAPMRGGYRL